MKTQIIKITKPQNNVQSLSTLSNNHKSKSWSWPRVRLFPKPGLIFAAFCGISIFVVEKTTGLVSVFSSMITNYGKQNLSYSLAQQGSLVSAIDFGEVTHNNSGNITFPYQYPVESFPQNFFPHDECTGSMLDVDYYCIEFQKNFNPGNISILSTQLSNKNFVAANCAEGTLQLLSPQYKAYGNKTPLDVRQHSNVSVRELVSSNGIFAIAWKENFLGVTKDRAQFFYNNATNQSVAFDLDKASNSDFIAIKLLSNKTLLYVSPECDARLFSSNGRQVHDKFSICNRLPSTQILGLSGKFIVAEQIVDFNSGNWSVNEKIFYDNGTKQREIKNIDYGSYAECKGHLPHPYPWYCLTIRPSLVALNDKTIMMTWTSVILENLTEIVQTHGQHFDLNGEILSSKFELDIPSYPKVKVKPEIPGFALTKLHLKYFVLSEIIPRFDGLLAAWVYNDLGRSYLKLRVIGQDGKLPQFEYKIVADLKSKLYFTIVNKEIGNASIYLQSLSQVEDDSDGYSRFKITYQIKNNSSLFSFSDVFTVRNHSSDLLMCGVAALFVAIVASGIFLGRKFLICCKDMKEKCQNQRDYMSINGDGGVQNVIHGGNNDYAEPLLPVSVPTQPQHRPGRSSRGGHNMQRDANSGQITFFPRYNSFDRHSQSLSSLPKPQPPKKESFYQNSFYKWRRVEFDQELIDWANANDVKFGDDLVCEVNGRLMYDAVFLIPKDLEKFPIKTISEEAAIKWFLEEGKTGYPNDSCPIANIAVNYEMRNLVAKKFDDSKQMKNNSKCLIM